MPESFNKYTYIKKSKSELERDKIINNLCLKLWNESGYATAHYLGCINQLTLMARTLRESDYLTKNDIVMLIAAYKENKDVSDEIKNLVDMILYEFDYKENTK